MASVKMLNISGEEVGKITLEKNVFNITPNNQVVYDALMVCRSNSRQGTKKTKKRDEVAGGGRKPWRQKGTGRARHGSIRSPIWRGGGVTFGPNGEQNFKIKQNRKERSLALKSVLSQKVLDKKLIIIDKCNIDEIKTKKVISILKALQVEGKVLFVIGQESSNLEFVTSSLNIPKMSVLFPDEINVYDIVESDYLVLTKEALETITEVLHG